MDRRPHLIPALVAAVMLFVAIVKLPYGYYQLLRWVVCGVSAYIAYLSYKWEKVWATWVFGFVAILFNPILPIHLTKEIWQPIDIICAMLFTLSPIFLTGHKTGKPEENP